MSTNLREKTSNELRVTTTGMLALVTAAITIIALAINLPPLYRKYVTLPLVERRLVGAGCELTSRFEWMPMDFGPAPTRFGYSADIETAIRGKTADAVVDCSCYGVNIDRRIASDLVQLQDLVLLDLSHSKLTGKEIVDLVSQFPGLIVLWVDGTSVSEADVKALTSHPSLTVVSASDTSLDAGSAQRLHSHGVDVHIRNALRITE